MKNFVIGAGNFWNKLQKPFFVMAPMANVTDSVFRSLFAKYGKPDVTWTEFVSADGLCSSEGKKKLLRDMDYSEKERPIVAQLFTGHPEAMKGAAKLVAKIGFDGLDINMGCPDRAVEKQGGGASMIKSQKKAIEVLEAAREGFKGPVSIKTRIGYNTIDLSWIKLLLEQRLPALTVHLRTRKEMSDASAHWDLMPEIIRMRNEISPETLIIGNGDVESMNDARDKVRKYGCDGVMIGRGIFGKPWFFEDIRSKAVPAGRQEKGVDRKEKTPEERLKIMLEHAKLFDKTYCVVNKNNHKNFAVMKKHFKAYVSGWPATDTRVGAKELRVQLMEVDTYKEVEKIVKE